MLNHITLQGRLVRDVELRSTQSGTPVASLTIACERDYQQKDKQADFVDIVAWNKTAEFISKYFVKGSDIIVSGRLQSRKWETKDGDKRTSWEVVADNVYFSGRKNDTNGFAEVDDDDDIPF